MNESIPFAKISLFNFLSFSLFQKKKKKSFKLLIISYNPSKLLHWNVIHVTIYIYIYYIQNKVII